MSMVVSSVDSPSRLGQAQAVAEQIFDWAGLNPTVLRFAGLFHENVLLLHGATIREKALIANSFGESSAPWISGSERPRSPWLTCSRRGRQLPRSVTHRRLR
jgi:hypothetical protein